MVKQTPHYQARVRVNKKNKKYLGVFFISKQEIKKTPKLNCLISTCTELEFRVSSKRSIPLYQERISEYQS